MNDVHIRELDFSNCYLPPEGLLSILCGLEKNKFIIALNLRGNNIKSIGTVEIGRFLRHNNYLQKLCLEWNGTGIFPEKFCLLCEGLGVNSSLKDLDLRNNSLNHICAQFLSEAICKNVTLTKLDLRWNNIGLLGGRAILKSLFKNKTLLSVNIDGNDIPSDIVNSVGIATTISTERFLTNNEHIQKTKFLITKLQDLEHEKNTQLKTLMNQLEKKDEEASSTERWTASKLVQLKETLSEKNTSINDLTVKLYDVQHQLASTVDENNDLTLRINQMQQKCKELKNEHQQEIENEIQKKHDMEKKLLEEMGVLKEENIFQKQQIQDLKALQTHLEDKNLKLIGNITKLEKMSKFDQSSFEEQLSSLNERHLETLQENEFLRKNEISKMRTEFLSLETDLRSKISLLESRNADKEKEFLNKVSHIAAEKKKLQEEIHRLEEQKKMDEEKIMQGMEERIEIIENSKKKLEELLQENLKAVHEMRKKATSVELELAEFSHKYQCLQQVLESKDAEIETCKLKTKLEMTEQLEELSDTKKLLQEAYRENETTNQQFKDLGEKHNEDMNKKNELIQDLNRKIEEQKRTIEEIKEDEKKRNLQLQLAFASYLNSGKPLDADDVNKSREQP